MAFKKLAKKPKKLKKNKEDEDMENEEEKDEQNLKDVKNTENLLFPDYEPILKEFEQMIQWKNVGSKKIPEPIQGLNEQFDEASARVDNIKGKL